MITAQQSSSFYLAMECGAAVEAGKLGIFWHFQYIEGSWLLVVSILRGAATTWLIRHRAA